MILYSLSLANNHIIKFACSSQELHKSYSVTPDLLEEKAPALTSVEGTVIEWKHKKNLCMTEVKKKQKAKSGRKAGQVWPYNGD